MGVPKWLQYVLLVFLILVAVFYVASNPQQVVDFIIGIGEFFVELAKKIANSLPD